MSVSAAAPMPFEAPPEAAFAHEDLSRIFKDDPIYGLPSRAAKRPSWIKRRKSTDKNADLMDNSAKTGADLAAITTQVLAPEDNQLVAGLALLGALGGYASGLIAARRVLAEPDIDLTDGHYSVLADDILGNRYVGQHVNGPLYDDGVSFWSLIIGAAVKIGHRESHRLLKLNEIERHVMATCQSADFGLPRMPEDCAAPDLPVNFVRHLWPEFLPVLNRYSDNPEGWALSFGFAVQEFLSASTEEIAPEKMAAIVMEFAFPMSRIGPDFLRPH